MLPTMSRRIMLKKKKLYLKNSFYQLYYTISRQHIIFFTDILYLPVNNIEIVDFYGKQRLPVVMAEVA
jgi:hypothetical protein